MRAAGHPASAETRGAPRARPRAPLPPRTGAPAQAARSRPTSSLPEPLEERGDVHLVGLVVARQCVHDDVDAGAECLLALGLPAGHYGIERAVAVIEGPGGSEVIGGHEDRADPVGAARLAALIRNIGRFRLDPELSAIPAT